MADDPTPIPSLKARIAALNLNESTATPLPVPAKKRPPPPPPANPPPRLSEDGRSQSASSPPQAYAPTNARLIGNQPAAPQPQQKHILPPPSLAAANDTQPARPSLPPRPSRASQAAPSLPPRRPSEQSIQRKESQESISTIASGRSVGSALSGRTSVTSGTTYGEVSSNRVKAPPFDPSKLPPLPPKRTQEQKDADLLKNDPVRAKYSSRTSNPQSTTTKPQPPSLPSRPSLPARPNTTQNGTDVSRKPRRSALEWGLNRSTEQAPALPASRPGQEPAGSPPPIPLSSRPDLAALQASKPKSNVQSPSCLKCRDFRAVDAHAARFPRTAIPSHDLSWLAHQLTDPFPSHTDKARALFTWLHHNIDYNAAAFFSGNVQPSTPASTLATGLAVCEGYAGLFTALASTVGLESVVVGGHGKGYGYAPLAPGAPVPPFECGHAWNAVRIDGGEWKLIDCCWGAGNVGDGSTQGGYNRHFSPECFYMDNDEFGLKHFPENPRYFFRNDGRPSISWEEYILAPPGANVFGFAAKAGLSETRFLPAVREIRVHDPDPAAPRVVRFQWEKRCPHYDGDALGDGKPYMYFLTIEGRGGSNKQFLPMESDGRFWWLDVERVELGVPGQSVMACVGDKWHGGPDGSGRGVTRAQWEANKYGFKYYNGVAIWKLV
ncbi:hypothetical protein B0J12DRAFT_217534 [Macrophomina phaseolina]|uniref:Transglutaminase-like domain-containing protein n=1 Tax=Macrophomina phaseolina TaxID=35725 RepID=A0ABQ8G136_9PEZI|nr:hypothetical protein B0J12DRAFT_217534 [Macrophomina phaseolina]